MEIVKANPWIFGYLAIQSRIIKAVLFIYMAVKLVRALRYFIQEKVDAMLQKSLKFTCFNKFIIILVYINIGMKALNILWAVIFLSAYQYYQVQDEDSNGK